MNWELYNLTGFVGLNEKSPNALYHLHFSSGHSDKDIWVNGRLALIRNGEILFQKTIERPNDCKVSNDGIVICCDWLNWTELSGCFKVFNNSGEELISIFTKANLGSNCISEDSKLALVETHNSENEDGNKIFLFDILNRKLIAKIEHPTSFIDVKIDSQRQRIILVEKDNIEFEIDFNGNQTNYQEHYQKTIDNGNANDVISYFYNKPREEKLADKNYLRALMESTIKDNERTGLDFIYREIGEFYDFWGETDKTIEYWTKAVDLNPKVGIKRRLNKLKTEK